MNKERSEEKAGMSERKEWILSTEVKREIGETEAMIEPAQGTALRVSFNWLSTSFLLFQISVGLQGQLKKHDWSLMQV